MSQSLPVIATDVGEVSTIIQNLVNGLLIPPGRPKEIVRAYKRIVTDNELRQRLVINGLEFARAHTVEAETDKMMKIVNDYFFSNELQ
jgi:glycosyltransferase involved in cell wall biosynthesis